MHACVGCWTICSKRFVVPYTPDLMMRTYQYTEESQRGILREKLNAWQRAAGAGVTACDGLNSESAFGELQLARPLHTYGFLPTIQRRLAVLRELGAAVAEEHRCGVSIHHTPYSSSTAACTIGAPG